MYEQSQTAPSDLDLLKNSSLTSILQTEIEKIILSGEFGPGERLNEKALATRFSVSRGPVREACRALAERGLVKLIPNRGVFIREITKSEAAELYDVRAALFGTACRLTAERITDQELADLRVLLARMDAVAYRRDIDEYYPINLEFHNSVAKYARNNTLMQAYRECVEKLHLFRARGLIHGGGFEVSNKEHRQIVEAFAVRDALKSFEAGYQHVQEGKIRILMSGEGPRAKQPSADPRN